MGGNRDYYKHGPAFGVLFTISVAFGLEGLIMGGHMDYCKYGLNFVVSFSIAVTSEK